MEKDAGNIKMWATYSTENCRMPVVVPRDAEPHAAETRTSVMEQVNASLIARGLVHGDRMPLITMFSDCEELDDVRSTSCMQAKLRGGFYSFQLCDVDMKAVAPADRLLRDAYVLVLHFVRLMLF
jgi:hypothetical protein